MKAALEVGLNRLLPTLALIVLKEKISWQELDEKSEGESDSESDDKDDKFNFSVEQIKNAIEQLPNGYRVVFNLFMFENYSHVEIATLLEITESTSKSQLFKAKNKLKEILVQSNNTNG
ncbi:MAG: sigma-70 family RNA polymerase sigma factor [Saprospirales bacterium]|nr:sigma-70 family RNA polymerase sigma factor [Saprospirales bacterium]